VLLPPLARCHLVHVLRRPLRASSWPARHIHRLSGRNRAGQGGRQTLSRARDPYYSSRSLADIIVAAGAQGQGEEDLEDEEEDASWRWEGEDDFTLGHVWDVRSRDPKRGIIYVRMPPLLSSAIS
jgi:hypothetical protein